MVVSLHPSQQTAIDNIQAQAVALRLDALSTLSHIFRMSNIPLPRLDEAHESIRKHARVALHFHPDRPVNGGRTVASALLEEGIYKSQFETGISNGLVATQAGGLRDEWERSLFNGAYHLVGDGSFEPSLRPKYGALDLMRNAEGPAPRFGSCYFLLKSEVSARSTFTFGGSQADPKHRGTIVEFDAILAALMEESFSRDFALGVDHVRPAKVLDYIVALKASPLRDDDSGQPTRNLDHVIEAQIHGDVLLVRDVEALVADPSFFERGETGGELKAMCKRYGFPLRLHHGYCMDAGSVPLDFRGPTMPSLAARVAKNGAVLDVEAIGLAVRDLTENPDAWKDRGTFTEVLQELKLLWHVLVRYGQAHGSSC
ncbi:hypothetical protein PT974_03201 [Cladobotryum mycophilum]|uniref:DUF3626 domain-containing protein n=1 Tax=Cladobotryum mycophilum TaxID=491253 RepID=A0ABR0SSA5_9HYPO